MQKRPKSENETDLGQIKKSMEKPGKDLIKNITVAAALVIGVIALRCGAVPGLEQAADVVVSAMNRDLLEDDRLGKLSFVSALFPEAALVFGEQTDTAYFQGSEVIHAWSEDEPYLLVKKDNGSIGAIQAGQVLEVRRESGGTWAVTVGDQREQTVYGNLKSASVLEGDSIDKEAEIGQAAAGGCVSVEMRSNGISIAPSGRQVSGR